MGQSLGSHGPHHVRDRHVLGQFDASILDRLKLCLGLQFAFQVIIACIHHDLSFG